MTTTQKPPVQTRPFQNVKTAPANQQAMTAAKTSAAAKQTEEKQNVLGLIQSMKGQIMAALPKHLSVDQFARVVMTEVGKNPQLAQADQKSFLGALMEISRLGLEPGSVRGEVYLLPFNNKSRGIIEVQVIPGYRGLMKLAKNGGEVQTITARLVRLGDHFEYQYGDDERITHLPAEDNDDSEVLYAYAIATMKDGSKQREVMTRKQIERIRDRKKYENKVWETDYEEMCRKTVVRRLSKYLPLSPDLARAIELDDMHFNGEGQANWQTIDMNHDPQLAPHDPGKTTKLQEAKQDNVPPATQQSAADDRANALKEVQQAVEFVKARNGDPEKILNMTGKVLMELPTNSIMAAVDMLYDWGADKPQTATQP